MSEGMKFDKEKPRMELLPPKALVEIAKVLTFGAEKYEPNNWRYVKSWDERYIGAALRHIVAMIDGEIKDPETGLDHAAHAACCMMFHIDNSFYQKLTEIEKNEGDVIIEETPY